MNDENLIFEKYKSNYGISFSEDAVTIDNGCIICAGTIITCNIKIGKFVTLNLMCTVGHDTVIGDYCTTNPGVHISGQIEIGECNEFGTGSIVRDRLKIGSNKTFGAQSATVKNINSNIEEIYVGVPSKILNK